MCGIAGIWLKTGADTARLDRAIAHFRGSLHHRGPDAFGVHRGEHYAFVNLRLAIVDRSDSGNQPFYAPEGRKGIVYNGEVYNWQALRAPLEGPGGFPFHSHTDTEVVLADHLARGDESFAALNGMFGLCIWDEDAKSFVLARDRFGAKPLYIYEDEHCIAFSSELRGLLGLDGLDLSPDAIGFQDYLAYRYNLAPRTLFKRIEKLPAGHLLRFTEGRRSDYRPFATLSVSEPPSARSEGSYVEELDALLGNAVRGQLMGEVPIGVLLSGGLDSSSIAAYVHKAGAHLKAYSIGFPEVNEFAFSRDVARKFELDYVELMITQDELRAGMDRVLGELDEPIADPACFALSRLCQRIREDVTVVLSGEGGDELFAGYGHHQLALDPALSRDELYSHFFHRSANNLNVGEWMRDKSLPLHHLRFRPLYDRADTALSGMQNFELHTWLPEDLMMKADKIAMAHSLEGRFPFLDNAVFDFAARLPRELKIPAPGSSKHVLRKLMEPQLPPSVLTRPKMGFTVPPAFFLAPLRERLLGAIESLRGSALDEVLNLAGVRATFERYYAAAPGTVPVFPAWNLAVLLLWWAEKLPRLLPHTPPRIAPALPLHEPRTMAQPTHHILCDGGFSNRFNALIFALVLRERFGGDWRISWPVNNWCGAKFEELFGQAPVPVDELGIEHFKQHEQDHVLLMHENQAGFDAQRLVINRQLGSWEQYAEVFARAAAEGKGVVYYNSLIPPLATQAELGRALALLRPNAEVARRAQAFCATHRIDAAVVGLHIRKTDFGDKVDDKALFEQARSSPKRFFVCSDDAEVNQRFASLANCAVMPKSRFPEKMVAEAGWQHWTQDAEGRAFPFNISRPSTAVVEGLIDQLILSRTSIMTTSGSTFQQTARLFGQHGFLPGGEPAETGGAAPAPVPERPVTPADLFELLDLIRPWQMRSEPKVRMGSDADGGYVMPATSKRSNLCLSIGIGNEVSFDEELGRQGATILQFDHTIEKSPSTHPACQYHRLGWGASDSHPLVTLKTMMGMADWAGAKHPILKFDTEGAEWSCLTQADSADLARFEVLTGEFHEFDHLPERKFFDTVYAVFKKLNQTHRVVHLHANNAGGMVMLGGVPFPRLLELTWARIDSFTFHGHSNEPIPGPLDRPNVPQLPDLHLRAF